MRATTKRRFFYLILIIIIAFIAFQVTSRIYEQKKTEEEGVVIPQEQQEEQQVRIVPVQTGRVQEGDIRLFLTVSGAIEPRETVRVYPKSVGQVKELLVKEGDIVQKDDILMRLDDEQIRLQVAQARATLDSAQASLEKVKAGARPQEISQAEAAVRQTKINLDSARENYQRMEKLFSEGAVAEQQFEQAKNQFEIAEAQYQSADESYKLVTEGAAEQDIKAVEAQVRQAQSALELAQSQLNNTIVRAPINGSITSVTAKTGEIVSSAVPLLVIVDTSELYLVTGISEKDVGSVYIGQEAEVFIDAFPQNTFSGEVTFKGVMVDPSTKTMEIKIRINNYDIEIPPGVFARANITTREKTNTLIVPSSALVRKRDGLYAFIVEEDTAKQRLVDTGISQGNQVEVLQGLEKDEEVVVSGNLTLQDGDIVRIINRGNRQ
jgi:ABC exporter DevB family membrane fusion protein